MTLESRRFRFVQFEFPWALGPAPGRYPIRDRLGEAPAFVLVLAELGAREHRRALRTGALPLPRRRRPRTVPAAPEPEPVLTSRATLVDAAPLAGPGAAAAWLRDADLDVLADAALARLNAVLHAHRVAAADPYARGVSRAQALVVRVGFGSGERVAEGRWDEALALAAGMRGGRALRPRVAALRPQERLAALLAGRDAALACEELTLRVRLDVDAARWREAALGLRVAVEAALAELDPWREVPGLPARVQELRARSEEVGALADAALQGGLDDAQIERVGALLGRVEAALRARTAGGL